MSTVAAASVFAQPARTPGQDTPGQALGDAGALFALLLGGILPTTLGSPDARRAPGQDGQLAALSPRPIPPPLTPSVEESPDAGLSMNPASPPADPTPHAVPAKMPLPRPEQAAVLVTAPGTTGGSSGQGEVAPILEVPPSSSPPLQSAGLPGTASPVDLGGQTPLAIEIAPRAQTSTGGLSSSSVGREGGLEFDAPVPTASPKVAPTNQPSAMASGRTGSIAEPVGPSVPAADPMIGQSAPDRSQPSSPPPAPVQVRAQLPIIPAAGVQLDRIYQTGDPPAGDARSIASIDGIDMPSGRAERGVLDLPVLPARAPGAPVALQIAHQIVRAANHRVERMVVQLEPADLGRVEVRLDFGHEGKMSAVISTDRPDALDLLQREGRALERSLEQAGLRLDSGGLSFALKRDSGQGQDSSGTAWSERPGDPNPSDAGPDQEAQHGAAAVLSLRLLDLHV